jgi:hypothetical protein
MGYPWISHAMFRLNSVVLSGRLDPSTWELTIYKIPIHSVRSISTQSPPSSLFRQETFIPGNQFDDWLQYSELKSPPNVVHGTLGKSPHRVLGSAFTVP